MRAFLTRDNRFLWALVALFNWACVFYAPMPLPALLNAVAAGFCTALAIVPTLFNLLHK